MTSCVVTGTPYCAQNTPRILCAIRDAPPWLQIIYTQFVHCRLNWKSSFFKSLQVHNFLSGFRVTYNCLQCNLPFYSSQCKSYSLPNQIFTSLWHCLLKWIKDSWFHSFRRLYIRHFFCILLTKNCWLRLSFNRNSPSQPHPSPTELYFPPHHQSVTHSR